MTMTDEAIRANVADLLRYGRGAGSLTPATAPATEPVVRAPRPPGPAPATVRRAMAQVARAAGADVRANTMARIAADDAPVRYMRARRTDAIRNGMPPGTPLTREELARRAGQPVRSGRRQRRRGSTR